MNSQETKIIEALDRLEQQASTALVILQIITEKLKEIQNELKIQQAKSTIGGK